MTAKRKPIRAQWPVLGYGAVLGGAFFIGVMPNAAKLSFAEGANTLAVLVVRAFLGTVILGGWLALRRQPLAMPREWVARSAMGALAFALSAVGGLGAIAYIDVSLMTIIFFMYPVPVAVAQHLSGATRLVPRTLVLIVLSLAGLTLALGVSAASLNAMGLILALLGLASVTVTILQVSAVSAAAGAVRGSLHMSLWAGVYFVAAALVLPPLGLIAPMQLPASGYGWALVCASGVAFTLGYLLFFSATTILGTSRATALSIVEPIMIILLAVVWVGESLGALQWAGLAVTLAALWAMEAFPARQPSQE